MVGREGFEPTNPEGNDFTDHLLWATCIPTQKVGVWALRFKPRPLWKFDFCFFYCYSIVNEQVLCVTFSIVTGILYHTRNKSQVFFFYFYYYSIVNDRDNRVIFYQKKSQPWKGWLHSVGILFNDTSRSPLSSTFCEECSLWAWW